jgi:hypothetical protein
MEKKNHINHIKKYKPYKKTFKKFRNPNKRYFRKRRFGNNPKWTENKDKQINYNRNPRKCKCYTCGEEGHISPNCPKKNKSDNIRWIQIQEDLYNKDYIPIEYEDNWSEIEDDEKILVIEDHEEENTCKTLKI